MHSQGVSVVAKKKYTEEEARERKKARDRAYKAKMRADGKMTMHDENMRQVSINLSTLLYADVLEYLVTRKNKSEYLKRLIRADMREGAYLKEYPKGKRSANANDGSKTEKKTIGITLSKTNDADVIEVLSQCANKPAYIAFIVRRDIRRKRLGIIDDD